jgi:predicted regulator of Ras-like GTPase activity (Roadblock/LC7/MglB family)
MIQSSPKIDKILENLAQKNEAIEAAAVVSIDGLPIAARLPSDLDDALLSAMGSALLTVGERAASDLEKGALQQVFAQGATGAVIMVSAGPDAVLMVSTNTASLAGLGLVFLEMERAAAQIAKHLRT